MADKPHSKIEIDNHSSCLNMITNELLSKLDNIGKEREQYFHECSVLGVDRLIILKSIRTLLKDNEKNELKKVEDYQDALEKEGEHGN